MMKSLTYYMKLKVVKNLELKDFSFYFRHTNIYAMKLKGKY